MFGANLVILTQIYNKLSHREAKFPRILSQNGQNDLEGQGQWPSFSAESIPGCMFGANLVILAQIYDKLQGEFPRILSQNGQNDLEGQGQWPPFSTPSKSIPVCMFGANLTQIYNELSRGQAEFPRLLSQNGQTDFEVQGQWPPFSIPTESIVRCIFGVNLVILDQICDELSCRQGKVYGRTQATTIPLQPERPRGKKSNKVEAPGETGFVSQNMLNFFHFYLTCCLQIFFISRLSHDGPPLI